MLENIVKFKPGAKFRYAYNSAGLDIATSKDYFIHPGDSILIDTGLYIEPDFKLPDPLSLAIQVWPRSGLSVKYNLETGAGLIDPDYRGEIKIHLYNFGTGLGVLKAGDYIAQIVFCVVVSPSKIKFVEIETLTQTERDEKGFGSSK